jgi:histidine triad (HIT) family protein
MDRDCSFCRIVEGTESARVVYETSRILAFFPLAPAVLGHTLVIPKMHIKDLWSLDSDWGAVLFNACLDISRKLRNALDLDGLNVINSAGAAASQTIMHVHFHIVPRWEGDSFGPIWPPSPPMSDELKDDVAAKIRRAVGRPG